MRTTIDQTEVERQDRQDEDIEQNPEKEHRKSYDGERLVSGRGTGFRSQVSGLRSILDPTSESRELRKLVLSGPSHRKPRGTERTEVSGRLIRTSPRTEN